MDNRDYLKEKFENDGIRAPESLSEDSILKMLEEADGAKSENKASEEKVFREAAPKKRMRIRPENRKVLAIAASAMIAIFGIAALSPLIDRLPDTSAPDGELYEFRSTSEIKKIIKSLDNTPSMRVFENRNQMVEESVDYESDMAVSDEAGSSESAKSAAAPSRKAPALPVERAVRIMSTPKNSV